MTLNDVANQLSNKDENKNTGNLNNSFDTSADIGNDYNERLKKKIANWEKMMGRPPNQAELNQLQAEARAEIQQDILDLEATYEDQKAAELAERQKEVDKKIAKRKADREYKLSDLQQQDAEFRQKGSDLESQYNQLKAEYNRDYNNWLREQARKDELRSRKGLRDLVAGSDILKETDKSNIERPDYTPKSLEEYLYDRVNEYQTEVKNKDLLDMVADYQDALDLYEANKDRYQKEYEDAKKLYDYKKSDFESLNKEWFDNRKQLADEYVNNLKQQKIDELTKQELGDRYKAWLGSSGIEKDSPLLRQIYESQNNILPPQYNPDDIDIEYTDEDIDNYLKSVGKEKYISSNTPVFDMEEPTLKEAPTLDLDPDKKLLYNAMQGWDNLKEMGKAEGYRPGSVVEKVTDWDKAISDLTEMRKKWDPAYTGEKTEIGKKKPRIDNVRQFGVKAPLGLLNTDTDDVTLGV